MGLLNAKPMLEFEAYIKPVGGLLIREAISMRFRVLWFRVSYSKASKIQESIQHL